MSHFHESQTEADLPPWHQGDDLIEDEPEPDEPPDDTEPWTPFEQTKAYRDQLIDAGRGHLV